MTEEKTPSPSNVLDSDPDDLPQSPPANITQVEWDEIKTTLGQLSGEEKEDPEGMGTGRTEALGKLVPYFVDDQYISWWKGHLRISFSESVGGKTRWRVALLMEEQDAEDLARVITKVLAKMKNKYAPESPPEAGTS